MPKLVDHQERRAAIARALWRVVDQQGWTNATMREVASEAGVSLGHVQHYFASRTALLTFAMEFAAEQTADRVARELAALEQRSESGQREEQIRLDVRVAVRCDLALRDRIADELRDQRATVPQPEARLLSQ